MNLAFCSVIVSAVRGYGLVWRVVCGGVERVLSVLSNEQILAPCYVTVFCFRAFAQRQLSRLCKILAAP